MLFLLLIVEFMCLTTFFSSKIVFLGIVLTLVRGPCQLSADAPRNAPLFSFSDLLEIETGLPEIKTALMKLRFSPMF